MGICGCDMTIRKIESGMKTFERLCIVCNFLKSCPNFHVFIFNPLTTSSLLFLFLFAEFV